METDNTYNGWKNRATWLVALWLDGTYENYQKVKDIPKTAWAIRQYTINDMYVNCEGFHEDIGNNPDWDSIDWFTIADYWNDD